ncbi:MAG: helix-turn-helix transcriptional regulator [Flavonifractor plautii]
MTFPLGAPLLDACVLAVLEKEDAYGYSLTQRMKEVVELSESTLYPVLRRLQQSGCLTVYDKPFQGRNRRYYAITPAGRALLAGYRKEWARYRGQIEELLLDERRSGMNKAEFLAGLRDALAGKLPSGELEDVLSYYEEYFADAGEEHEAEAAEGLGSPASVAAQVLEGRTGQAPSAASAERRPRRLWPRRTRHLRRRASAPGRGHQAGIPGPTDARRTGGRGTAAGCGRTGACGGGAGPGFHTAGKQVGAGALYRLRHRCGHW